MKGNGLNRSELKYGLAYVVMSEMENVPCRGTMSSSMACMLYFMCLGPLIAARVTIRASFVTYDGSRSIFLVAARVE